jgi:stringent starvation protein B
MVSPVMSGTSTKPYLIRAIFEWCNDNGLTPHLAVTLGDGVVVPTEFAKDGEIVLNISPLATNRLTLDNDGISFQARFGGVAREISVPIHAVRAIYARENGEGMGFASDTPVDTAPPADEPPPAPRAERPKLTRIK